MKILTLNTQIGVGAVNSWFDFILSLPKYLIPRSHKKLEDFGKMLSDEDVDIATFSEIEGESFRSSWRNQVEVIRKNSQLDYKKFFSTNQG